MDDYEIIKLINYDILKKEIINEEFINKDNFTIINKINSIDTISIDILKEMKNNNLLEHNIYIKKNFLIKDVKSSFKDNDSIFKQFKLDLPRCEIFINNYKIDDAEYFKHYLSNKFNSSIVFKILMLSTQSSLALPYIFIKNNICNDNYHLVNLNKNKEKNYKINIEIDELDIKIIIIKKFYIIKIDKYKKELLFTINMRMDISLTKNDLISINYIVTKFTDNN